MSKFKQIYLKTIKNICVKKSNKYQKYYNDTYSIELLKARQTYIKTGNLLTFLNAIIKNQGDDVEFRLFDKIPDNVGGRTIIIFNKYDDVAEYTEILFKHSKYRDNVVLCDIAKWGTLVNVSDTDIVIPVLTDQELRAFLNGVFEKGYYYNNLYIPKRRVMNAECGIQYLDLFEPDENEIIVNAGCLDCKTDIEMIKWGQGNVKKIFAIEPDPNSARLCRKVIAENSIGNIVTLVEKGAWSRKKILKINSSPDAIGSGKIGKWGGGGRTTIEADAIDNIVGEEAITFIKMDIEGAELQALKGAKRTIFRNKPKLAICIYHNDSDIYRIPAYILSIVPEYRFYIRHYNSNAWETVLYAICSLDNI